MSTHRIYGLVGYPLGHSFSRAYFTEKFAREHIDAEYRNFELPAISELPQDVLSIEGLRGFNVTIPYKRDIIPFLDRLSPQAEAIGAVNVVKVEADGSLTGHNSDIVGFCNSLRPMLERQGLLADGIVRHGTRALVLGTGGASAAVIVGLQQLGVEVTTVSRRLGVADTTYAGLTAEDVARHKIIVNATPLGMYPNVDAAPDIPYEGVTPSHVCFDLVYNPADTLFMQKCAAQGADVKNGLEMLHGQAIEAWRIWSK